MTSPQKENWEEEAEQILQEFAGKVKYYELPKDLSAHTYVQSDLDRGISRIGSMLSKQREEDRAKIKALGEKEHTCEHATPTQTHTPDGTVHYCCEDIHIGYREAISDALEALL